jgi:hypothetical protein
MSKQLATGAGITVGATLLMGGAAQAATLTVGTTDDTSGATDCAVATNTDCSLRDAIDEANADPGSTVTFRSGVTGTITPGSTLTTITEAMTITGPGAGQLTVDGNYAVRPFYVDTASGTDVSISGLTIANGSAGSKGGGIYSKYADLTLSSLVLDNNESSSQGGGVAVRGGTLTIEDSTISDNVGTRGSGVYAYSGSGAVTTIQSSTVSGNSGADFGGGVYFDYSAAGTLENSTVYDNSAGSAGGGVYHFGAYNGDPGLVVTSSTITRNDADRGGGIACYGATGNSGTNQLTEPAVRNTIVFGNTSSAADTGPDLSCDANGVPDNKGTVPVGFSLIGSADPGTTIDTTGPNLTGVDPQLTTLADFGGPTQAQKPAATSPVIDAGSAFGLTSDQRGLARTVDAPTIANAADGTDIGAVELQAGDVPPAPVPVTPTTPTKKKCKKHKKKHKRSAESAKKCKKKKKKKH